MANKTTNYNLIKPLPEEFYDVGVHNANMDIIDSELSKRPTINADGKIPAEQLPEISSTKLNNVVLNANNWNENADGRFYQTVNVPEVTTDTKIVIVDVALSTDDVDAKVAYLEGWLLVASSEVEQGNGTLTFYCFEKPSVNIPVNIGVM